VRASSFADQDPDVVAQEVDLDGGADQRSTDIVIAAERSVSCMGPPRKLADI
jgi:hypothetical protein